MSFYAFIQPAESLQCFRSIFNAGLFEANKAEACSSKIVRKDEGIACLALGIGKQDVHSLNSFPVPPNSFPDRRQKFPVNFAADELDSAKKLPRFSGVRCVQPAVFSMFNSENSRDAFAPDCVRSAPLIYQLPPSDTSKAPFQPKSSFACNSKEPAGNCAGHDP